MGVLASDSPGDYERYEVANSNSNIRAAKGRTVYLPFGKKYGNSVDWVLKPTNSVKELVRYSSISVYGSVHFGLQNEKSTTAMFCRNPLTLHDAN
jgi:hypothetical protein